MPTLNNVKYLFFSFYKCVSNKGSLTFDQIPEHPRHDLEHILVPDPGQDLGGDGQDIGAAHHRPGLVPVPVDGGLSSPGFRVVQNVVVQEGGGVDHLHDDGNVPLRPDQVRVRMGVQAVVGVVSMG